MHVHSGASRVGNDSVRSITEPSAVYPQRPVYVPGSSLAASRSSMGVQTVQENRQQALDVIQQGLAMQDNADAGYDATRCVRP